MQVCTYIQKYTKETYVCKYTYTYVHIYIMYNQEAHSISL